jgi:hypothetical protein
MSVVTNKIIGSKAIMDSKFLTLEMYCGLHFQFRRALLTLVKYPVSNNIYLLIYLSPLTS